MPNPRTKPERQPQAGDEQRTKPELQPQAGDEQHDPGDLEELLQEVRILLQGAQMLNAFLIILPFSPGFAKLQQRDRWVYVATFACSLCSLVLFNAPAAQHRLERPLRDHLRFKLRATRLTIIGVVMLSLALVLATQLVVSQVIGELWALAMTAVVALLIAVLWWLLPVMRKRKHQT